MSVLVTGSSGLIGSALVRALEAGGRQVVRLERGPGWDPERAVFDPARLKGIDAVIHLAGPSIAGEKWSPARKQVLRDARVNGTRALSEGAASASTRPATIISASAIGIYGNRGDEILTEASDPGSDFLADLCRDWEAATEPARAAGIRVVNIRSGIVLDAAGGALAQMLLPFRLGLGGRLGNGHQWFSWISLEDEVRGILHVLDSELRGPVNISAPTPVTNAEYTKALGRALHRPTLFPVPLAPLRLMFGRELVDSGLLGSQRVLPASLQASGFEFRHPTIDGALAAALA